MDIIVSKNINAVTSLNFSKSRYQLTVARAILITRLFGSIIYEWRYTYNDTRGNLGPGSVFVGQCPEALHMNGDIYTRVYDTRRNLGPGSIFVGHFE